MAANFDPDMYTLPFQLTKRMHRDVYPALDPQKLSHLAAGKVVLVTGAGGGLGFAIAKMWAESGAKGVVLVGRDAKKLEDTVSDIKGDILIAAGDLSNEDNVKGIFDKSVAKYGTVDVVVNAAGRGNVDTMIGKVLPSQWWLDYEANVKGLYNLAHHFINMTNGTGTLINLVSLGASFLIPGMSSYSSAKLAAIKLGEYLDLELPNLRTFSIHPGIVEASSSGRGMVIDAFTPVAKDKQELTAAMTLYLQKPEAEFLRGGFMSVNWDVEQMERHREEIVEGKLLRLGFIGGKLGPDGHPWTVRTTE
ncbi:NAD(P)-binding protein [Lentithecium fluviatile CBS 122367]|uniref:NAD(P)-binding protein n=1 Tax=Lentithecium fluviatile CBS 122367 TaxID=1168545 RepID=A0A6G1IPQ9_9PLEO|nr:NAD(P)-binding protein [Lentithecium fluviatile CBS 122367]